ADGFLHLFGETLKESRILLDNIKQCLLLGFGHAFKLRFHSLLHQKTFEHSFMVTKMVSYHYTSQAAPYPSTPRHGRYSSRGPLSRPCRQTSSCLLSRLPK